MEFELTADQQLLRDTVRDFARGEIVPVAERSALVGPGQRARTIRYSDRW
jgi:hypothetical protein